MRSILPEGTQPCQGRNHPRDVGRARRKRGVACLVVALGDQADLGGSRQPFIRSEPRLILPPRLRRPAAMPHGLRHPLNAQGSQLPACLSFIDSLMPPSFSSARAWPRPTKKSSHPGTRAQIETISRLFDHSGLTLATFIAGAIQPTTTCSINPMARSLARQWDHSEWQA